MTKIENATHVAYVDDMTGVGVMILPNPDMDISSPTSIRPTVSSPSGDFVAISSSSVHAAGWNSIVRTLHAAGWEPQEDEDGDLMHVGRRPDGREVVCLYGRDPIISEPSLSEIDDALTALRLQVGLTSA